MSIPTLEELDSQVWDTYTRWQNAQREYLETTGMLYIAKFDMTKTIDDAYRDGVVIGKNEREREACLRELHPELHKEIDQLERKARIQERTLRDAEVAAESIKLRVAIALGSIALIK